MKDVSCTLFADTGAKQLMLLYLSQPVPELDAQYRLKSLSDGLYYQAPQKHLGDSFVKETGEAVLILEGIIANGAKLLTDFALPDLKALFTAAIQNEDILAKAHGQFFLIYYDKKSKTLKAYTNISSTVRLYYYWDGKELILSDKIRQITNALKAKGISYSISELGARMTLSYGYMLEGFTTIKEVKQIPSASVLCLQNGKCEVKRYFSWDFETRQIPEKEIYPRLTELFSQAVDCAFKRDEDRQHLAFLSGGLDSRVVVYSAHKLGYKGFETLNFSEPGYLDHTIAQSIARELKLKLNFFSLARGQYLLQLPENLVYNEGQIVLHGAAHLFQGIKSLPIKNYGILHSGQIGDILKGSYLQARGHTPVNLVAAAYSTRILKSFSSQIDRLRDCYPHHEAFVFYNRGLNGIINGDLASYQDSFSLSPFLEPLFVQYCLKLDPALRQDSRLYLNWMKHSFAQAARHKWEKTGAKASDPFLIVKLKYNLWRGSDKILRMLTKEPNRLNMIPFDYWWQINKDLKEHFEQERALLEELKPLIDTELYQETLLMSQSPIFSEKLQAYTLALSALYLMGKYDFNHLQRYDDE